MTSKLDFNWWLILWVGIMVIVLIAIPNPKLPDPPKEGHPCCSAEVCKMHH
jgi:hypothetical protein